MGGLFNSTVLDAAIGLGFVYLLLAVFCTAVTEWISSLLQTRSKMLEKAIRGLLSNQPAGANQFASDFYAHPLIATLMRDAQNPPAYLASRTFAATVINLTAPGGGNLTYQSLVDGINQLPNGDVKTTLSALVSHANGDLLTARRNIEAWFDDAMDRVSGWYRRLAQARTIAVAAILTLAANADTINILRRLWVDTTVRATIVESAKQRAQTQDPAVPTASDLTPDEKNALGGLIGWNRGAFQIGFLAWLQRILGWAFTALAVSLGAPFWFDTLTRIINIRAAGNVPDKGPPPSPPPAPVQNVPVPNPAPTQ